MSKNSENTQFQNATASTLKAISGNMIDEREIKFSGSTGYLSSKEVRLPIISKELDDIELFKLRGEADKIALRSFIHNTKHLSNVVLIPRAISTDSNQRIYFGANHTSTRNCTLGDSMSQTRDHKKYDDDYLVSTISLSDILNRYTDVSLLKCDIEGGEEVLLPILFQTCHTNRINMWLSFHYSWWSNKNIHTFASQFELASRMMIYVDNQWFDLKGVEDCILYIRSKPFATILFVMSGE